MKKVLVLASLGLLALSFACGGSKDTGSDDQKTSEGQSAFVFNSMIPAIVDGTEAVLEGITNSVHVDTAVEDIDPVSLTCDSGNIDITGTANGDQGILDLIFDFNNCSIVDPLCETGQNVTANGSLNFVIQVNLSGDEAVEEINVDTSLDGTITITGIFEKSCVIDINTTNTIINLELGPVFEDFNFTGTICGVNIQEILDIEETEREELCQTL